jgi:hypothetical protein
MGYLRLQDYYNKRIQKAQLEQITGNRDVVRLSCEAEAQAEMISYLVQKYEVSEEFSNTPNWEPSLTYYANNRFELDGAVYSATSTYALNQVVSYNNKVYYCIVSIGTPEVFNPLHWQLIGVQYDLYYVDTPYPNYNSKTYYEMGELIYFKNKIYKCVTANMGILPTDTNYGTTYWGIGNEYKFNQVQPYNTVADYTEWSNLTTYNVNDVVKRNGVIYQAFLQNTDVKPENSLTWQPIVWVKGDNRSQQLIGYMIDLCLEKIHYLIAPNNIPQIRKDNADYAIEWLKSASGRDSAITADIPLIQPNVGLRIRWGSKPRNINNY